MPEQGSSLWKVHGMIRDERGRGWAYRMTVRVGG